MSYAPQMGAGAPVYTLRQQEASWPAFEASRGRSAPAEGGKPSFMARAASPLSVFVVSGVILLVFLSIIPVWNAVALLQDANYVFWQGEWVPQWMLCQCGAIVFLYLVTVVFFFRCAKPQAQTEQAIMTIANIFIVLFGVSLMLVSMPLSQQVTETYNSLVPQCTFNKASHRLHEYAEVLLNIRSRPECINLYSVEECAGYEQAPPYTNILKAMEAEFLCSGFCHQPAAAAAVAATVRHNKTAVALQQGPRVSRFQSRVRAAMLDASAAQPSAAQLDEDPDAAELSADGPQEKANTRYPPTLFSNANYKASCDGMVARDIKNFAGDVAAQTYYQGVYLLVIAVVTSFLKMLGVCGLAGDSEDKM